MCVLLVRVVDPLPGAPSLGVARRRELLCYAGDHSGGLAVTTLAMQPHDAGRWPVGR